LALARGLLQGCPVLVLDEPTTGLDAQSEHALLETLRQVASGRTTVIITHRMAAAMAADQIVVLDAGRVVERGTHHRLITGGGLYAEMCRLQGITGLPPTWNGTTHGNGHHPSRQSKLDADHATHPRGSRQ
jgi:ATP-binding cassette subfamily B protein